MLTRADLAAYAVCVQVGDEVALATAAVAVVLQWLRLPYGIVRAGAPSEQPSRPSARWERWCARLRSYLP